MAAGADVLAIDTALTSLGVEGLRFSSESVEVDGEAVRNSPELKSRIGRTEPGVGYRLWGEAEQAALRPFAPAEITQADLAPLALTLAAWGAAPALHVLPHPARGPAGAAPRSCPPGTGSDST